MFPVGAEATIGELTADSHPLLARLRVAEPVSWLPALDGWLVTRHDLATETMRDAATFTVDDPRFSTAQVVGPSMLSLDGAEHARHRAPFTRSFRPRDVHDRFAALVVDETRRLIAELPAGRAELRRDLAGPLSVAVVATALGLSTVDAPTVLRWYDAIVSAVSGVSAGRAIPQEATTAFAQLHASVAATVARRDETSLVGTADL